MGSRGLLILACAVVAISGHRLLVSDVVGLEGSSSDPLRRMAAAIADDGSAGVEIWTTRAAVAGTTPVVDGVTAAISLKVWAQSQARRGLAMVSRNASRQIHGRCRQGLIDIPHVVTFLKEWEAGAIPGVEKLSVEQRRALDLLCDAIAITAIRSNADEPAIHRITRALSPVITEPPLPDEMNNASATWRSIGAFLAMHVLFRLARLGTSLQRNDR
ncbi:Uncharacterized protein PBTT_05569 [Plasmodiophora brassicae]